MKKTRKTLGYRKAFGSGVRVGYAKATKEIRKPRKKSIRGKQKVSGDKIILHSSLTNQVDLRKYRFVENIPNSSYKVYEKK